MQLIFPHVKTLADVAFMSCHSNCNDKQSKWKIHSHQPLTCNSELEISRISIFILRSFLGAFCLELTDSVKTGKMVRERGVWHATHVPPAGSRTVNFVVVCYALNHWEFLMTTISPRNTSASNNKTGAENSVLNVTLFTNTQIKIEDGLKWFKMCSHQL